MFWRHVERRDGRATVDNKGSLSSRSVCVPTALTDERRDGDGPIQSPREVYSLRLATDSRLGLCLICSSVNIL